MALAIPARPISMRLGRVDLPMALGLVGGLLLPLVSALLFPTYVQMIEPDWIENARHQGLVYLAGEVALVMVARHRGYDPAALFRTLPGWSRAALTLFLSTYWISSAFVSLLPSCSIMLSLGWAVHLLFAGAVFHLARDVAPERMERLWIGFAVGLGVLAIVTLAHFTLLPLGVRGHEREIDWGAAVPGFLSVRHFGSWTGAVLAGLTGLAWTQRDGRGRHLVHAGVALAFGLTFWTATRAAVLGWAVVLPVAWIVADRPRRRGFWTELPLWCLGAVAIASLLQPYGHPAYAFWRAGGVAAPDAYSSGRLTLWLNTLEVWRHHLLFGTGAGSTWWLVNLHGATFVQPHNAVVQFLMNWGLVATIPALALLGGATWHAHRAARRHRDLLPPLLMLDCLLAMSLLEGMLHFPQFVMLILGCLAICFAQTTHRAVDA